MSNKKQLKKLKKELKNLRKVLFCLLPKEMKTRAINIAKIRKYRDEMWKRGGTILVDPSTLERRDKKRKND